MLPPFLPERAQNRFLEEPARKIPVLTRCDVAVFGGGPAGVCAAAAAARMGKRVVLIEHYGFLGGVATAANVCIWHSLYGMDRQTKIIGGIPEEIIRDLQRQKAIVNMTEDGETGPWNVCTETAKLTLDDLVIHSGARLLLHTTLVGVIREGERVIAALVESKSGRQAIEAGVFIDCTGDADLVRRTGLSTQFGNAEGHCQPPSLCFRVGGIGEVYDRESRLNDTLLHETMDYNGEPYPCFLWGARGVWDPQERMMAGVRVPKVNAADVLDLTRAEVEGRYQMRWVLGKMRQQPGGESIVLRDIATQIGVRESHRIHAEHALQREEILEGQSFADTIAHGTYPIDIHNPLGRGIVFEEVDGTRRGIRGDGSRYRERWDGQPEDAPRRSTLCYQVPYRSLIPKGLSNVLAAGRCIGADHRAAGAIRVMINAMQFGQAAGTAAALAGSRDVRQVTGGDLREQLGSQGMPLLTA